MCFDSSEQERFDAFEFIVLIPLPTRSMLFMISAHDSIAMYLAIEPQSLCFYVMAASKRKSEFSTEAGSKYLILVPMEIPLGLIPRLMTYLNWEAWRKVKIEGNREKCPSGVFRRCNLGNERKRGPILQLEERPVGSPNPDPASHVLQVRRDPVPNYRLLPELRYRSRARNGR
ncbi:NADH-ubiquinone oxidoreductase chain 2, partial [Mucuna pruriens]